MEIRICKNAVHLDEQAAKYTAEIFRNSIAENDEARIVLSTGAP